MNISDPLTEFSIRLNELMKALEKQYGEENEGNHSNENVNEFLTNHKYNVYNQINALKVSVFAAYGEPNNGMETDKVIHAFWRQLLNNLLDLVEEKLEPHFDD